MHGWVYRNQKTTAAASLQRPDETKNESFKYIFFIPVSLEEFNFTATTILSAFALLCRGV